MILYHDEFLIAPTNHPAFPLELQEMSQDRPRGNRVENFRHLAVDHRNDIGDSGDACSQAFQNLLLASHSVIDVLLDLRARVPDHGTVTAEQEPRRDLLQPSQGVDVSTHVAVGRRNHHRSLADDVVSREEPAASSFVEAAVTGFVARRVDHFEGAALDGNLVSAAADAVGHDAREPRAALVEEDFSTEGPSGFCDAAHVIRMNVRDEDPRQRRSRSSELGPERIQVRTRAQGAIDQRDAALADEVLIRSHARHDPGIRGQDDTQSRLDLHPGSCSTTAGIRR